MTSHLKRQVLVRDDASGLRSKHFPPCEKAGTVGESAALSTAVSCSDRTWVELCRHSTTPEVSSSEGTRDIGAAQKLGLTGTDVLEENEFGLVYEEESLRRFLFKKQKEPIFFHDQFALSRSEFPFASRFFSQFSTRSIASAACDTVGSSSDRTHFARSRGLNERQNSPVLRRVPPRIDRRVIELQAISTPYKRLSLRHTHLNQVRAFGVFGAVDPESLVVAQLLWSGFVSKVSSEFIH